MKPSSQIPPLKALRAFQVAGEYLSFKLAAEELCVTASAVSHQVKKLEGFLGFELFERKTRAIAFTEAGKNYHDFLSGMFARLEAETHQVRAAFGRRIVRLCVPPFFAQELLMPRLDELEALAPGTDIRLFMQPATSAPSSGEIIQPDEITPRRRGPVDPAGHRRLAGPRDDPAVPAAHPHGLFARLQEIGRAEALPRPRWPDADRA